MSLHARFCRRSIGLALVIGLACTLAGCDAGGGKTEYKPIESNILKKLGQANQSQSDLAKTKLPVRAKKKL
jgi:hypothetical protein